MSQGGASWNRYRKPGLAALDERFDAAQNMTQKTWHRLLLSRSSWSPLAAARQRRVRPLPHRLAPPIWTMKVFSVILVSPGSLQTGSRQLNLCHVFCVMFWLDRMRRRLLNESRFRQSSQQVVACDIEAPSDVRNLVVRFLRQKRAGNLRYQVTDCTIPGKTL
jgi:hypothetical protein